MTRWALALLVACGGQSPVKPIENVAPVVAVVPADDREQLIGAVLDAWAADPSTIPDSKLITGKQFVLVELGGPSELIDTAHVSTPRVHGTIEWRTSAQLQAIANSKGVDVAFVRFHAIRITGETAEVSVGTDLMIPQQTQAMKMCCCSTTDRWEKRGGHWERRGRLGADCS